MTTRRQFLKATGLAAAAAAAGIPLHIPEPEEAREARDTAELSGFEMPDEIGKSVASHPIKGIIAFTIIEQDYDAENPCEGWDGVGRIYSFSRRHINCPSWLKYCYSYDDIQKYIIEEHGDKWAPLGYFEHGLCDWHISGNIPRGTEGDYRWDGVRFAGFWAPDQELLNWLKDFPEEQHQDKLREWAAQACEVYTDWCNGNVYCYSVLAFIDRPPYDRLADYRYEDEVYEDHCCGYYGWEGLEGDVIASYNRMLTEVARHERDGDHV